MKTAVFFGSATVLAMISGCAPSRQPPSGPHDVGRRALLISVDGLSEGSFRELPGVTAPSLTILFGTAACALDVEPAFPSLTAPGHAAIATGAYGRDNGVAANYQPVLPRGRHRLNEVASGFRPEALNAEPIWVTAAAAGLAVVNHHFPHSPRAPGYPLEMGPDYRSSRVRAAAALDHDETALVYGYSAVLNPGQVITHEASPTRIAEEWEGLNLLPASALPPREASWATLSDSVHALFFGSERYTEARISLVRDVSKSVHVRAVEAVQAASPELLAQHFSEPLRLSLADGQVFVRARLFHLSADGAEFILFQPPIGRVEANRADVERDYDAAVQGWAGNGTYAMGRSRFGIPLAEGGDGTAEERYLETVEYVIRQGMAGLEWAWNNRKADLVLDYVSIADEIDHLVYGWLARDRPGFDSTTAAKYARFRNRAWSLVDLRLGHAMQLVAGDSTASLFITGDHGMRAYWRLFRPNVVLKNAGLLVQDQAGNVDVSRSRALSPNGFWVSVNTTEWRDGIVPEDSLSTVLDVVERALTDARGPEGDAIVTRVWRADKPGELPPAAGGAVGGDLYYDLARGYFYSHQLDGPVVSEVLPSGGHGFPPASEDMRTIFCARGPGLQRFRSPPARLIDVAPTVADWLGIPAPAHATGQSLLPDWD